MSEYIVESTVVGNYTVNVLYDEFGLEPFDEDLLPTWGIDMSNHRDYNSPTYGDAMPISMELAMSGEATYVEDVWRRMKFFQNYYVLPIYMYDHSGRTISTGRGGQFSDPWDSGCTGFVYVGRKVFSESAYYGVRKSWPAARREELARKFLRSMVQQLDYYMTGQVYCFDVVDADGDTVDSCSGFVGDVSECMAAGVDAAEAIVRDDRLTRLRRVKQLIQNRVPLNLRAAQLT